MQRSSNWPRRLLAVALVCAGCAIAQRGAADEPTSSRPSGLWPWSSRKVPEAKKDGTGQPVSETRKEAEAARRLRAELDWKRRSEVCQKLRQIAYETKDDELDRFAERLDQRAWDVYVRRLGRGAVPFEPAVDFDPAEPGPMTLPMMWPTIREDQR
ncbi:MAG: hypothetical protein L0Y71_13760 [Gemmataceae bacterium]|nr:hypothetical protein [Gemmataceae bacterium]